jgi:hypothetical protein
MYEQHKPLHISLVDPLQKSKRKHTDLRKPKEVKDSAYMKELDALVMAGETKELLDTKKLLEHLDKIIIELTLVRELIYIDGST